MMECLGRITLTFSGRLEIFERPRPYLLTLQPHARSAASLRTTAQAEECL